MECGSRWHEGLGCVCVGKARAWWRVGEPGRGGGEVGVDGEAEETLRVNPSRIYLRVCTVKDFWQIWKACVYKSVSTPR